uniref:glycosyltransferase n=1 Tax=Pedobacter schmidteae TaxID=2201271 RepID=UPI000EAE19B6|nr:glycosyltransferase [Pedobacter schmidteae]
MNVILFFLAALIGYNLVVPIIFYFAYIFFGKKNRYPKKSGKNYDYAIIVTAYEQTELIPAVVSSLLAVNYDNYLIYVVLDNCKDDNIFIDHPKVILLRPEKVLAGNTRSHFYAINHFKRDHEILTIIDSDNLVDAEYINELNVYFNYGFEAVQGLRAAKKLNTTYACLDAARDIYYHFYDAKLLFSLGSSATLAGSGMAFKTELYKSALEHLDVQGAGFDKVLQAQILKKDKRIAFAGDAIVYDEKTSNPEQLVKQRSRWINTWFKYAALGFDILVRGVRNFSINQFLFGIVLLRPPLFIFLILSFIFMIGTLFMSVWLSVIWLLAFILFIAGFFIALKSYPTDKRIYTSLINIPKFIFYQLVSLVYVRKANKRSVATKHSID